MNIRRYILSLLLLCSCLAAMSAVSVPDVRSVVRQDGVVVESTDYYPYGTPFTTGGAVQPYKYGAKELDRMHGLDLYDSQARWYDSLLGRTSTLDPKAEKYYRLSPYTWCAGNPVRFVDPQGDVIETLWDVANVVMDVTSLIDNIKKGNIKEAAKDAVGTVVDVAATLVPGIPGGAGATLKMARTADRTIDIGKVAIHGNSKASTKAQHLYEIYETKKGDVVKTGISGGKVSKQGKSYRATRQVNKWNKEEGAGTHDSRIVQEFPKGPGAREAALQAEEENAQRLRKQNQLKDPQKHKKPQYETETYILYH